MTLYRPRPLVGRTITEVRQMNKKELEIEGWDVGAGQLPPPVLVLDDGQKLYPSRDSEGNGFGALFGMFNETPYGISVPN